MQLIKMSYAREVLLRFGYISHVSSRDERGDKKGFKKCSEDKAVTLRGLAV